MFPSLNGYKMASPLTPNHAVHSVSDTPTPRSAIDLMKQKCVVLSPSVHKMTREADGL